jgi:NhaP-type Na+/H+ or K+/H+ antiporter
MTTQVDGAHVSAGARVARIVQNVIALLRLRLDNARQDTKRSVRRLLMGAVFAAAAVATALTVLPLLATTTILFLAQYMAAWMAAGVVLVTMLGAGAILALLARSRLRWTGVSLPEDLKADWQAIRQQLEERR